MTYTKDTLRQIFQQPFNQQEWQTMLHKYFHAKNLRAEPERINNTPDDEAGYYLGKLNTDSYSIGLFYYQIQHGNVARKRVGLRNLVKSFINPNWGEFDAALVVFDSGTVWRLSFVCDIKGENTAAKRFTYVFGESDNYYNTPVGRFDALQRKGISFENIKDAFSVEALSKEFFDEYREHYADIVEYITGKRYVKEKGKWVEKTIHEPCHEIFDQFVAVYKDPEKTVRDYIKKLMGRLVFLQFLQKKEWMGVPADHQDWKGGDTRFLQNKFNEFADKDNFIDGFLEPLFNDLNTNRQNSNDLASPQVGNGIKVPFLNGGLFQLDEEDCSNIRLPQHLLGDVLEFFERYNFTIDENDPNDAQIGVDPEMLGRVFENLLEDNKDKGAFYTPKEIVQYMCQESLIAYLQTGIDNEADKESIRQFVLTHEAERLRVGDGTSGMHLGSMAEDISIKLLNVKICDPAIGSGAFPMGLLRQLYLCQCAIHPGLEEKNAADIKRHIIQNNIYGVDIEKGAVDIARLRFWLSLIVDEETPRFLPNLDFKIMQGNSLLEQYKGVDLSKMTELSSEQGEGMQLTWFDNMLDVLRLDLRKKLDEYYNCSDHQRKEQLKQEIIENVKQQLREQSINVDFGDLDLSANDQFTLWHTWFYDVFSQGGFDIVIGNPPYVLVQSFNNPQLESLYKKSYNVASYKIDLFHLFIEAGYKVLNKDGVLSFINPTTFLTNNYTQPLRDLLLKRTVILSIVNIGDNVFDASVNTGIEIFIKRQKTNNVLNYYFAEYEKEKLSIKKISSVLQTDYLKVEKHIIQPITSNESYSLSQKIESKAKLLKEYASVNFGMQLRNRKVFTNDVLVSPSPEMLTPYHRKCLTGKDISDYVVFWNSRYCYFNEEARCGGCWIESLHNSRDKILVRQVGAVPVCGIDTEGLAVLNSAFMIVCKRINPFGTLGILNSKLIKFYWQQKFEDKRKTFPKIKGTYLELLPIIPPTDEITRLVKSILSLKQKSLSNDTSTIEQQVDILVYHLYDLTYDEVLIVDPETTITREEYENS